MKLLTTLNTLRAISSNPFDFISDVVIKIVVGLVIPVPLAGDMVSRLKKPILATLAGLLILAVMMFVTMITILISVFLTPSGFLELLTASLAGNTLITSGEGFIQATIPSQNPFGGAGMIYTAVTAGYLDPGYFLQFGKPHTGIDLVPSKSYYENSNVYEQNKKVVIFATHTGTATYYTDENGGKTVEVLNDTQDLKTVYIHFKDVYVRTGDTIQAGTALGQMGGTGFATGEHLHYEIRVRNGSEWATVNPLSYIK